MLILSHRGYHRSCPENTLAAFEQAVALGVDGFETDIRLDVQGIPILFHDRVAPTGVPVSNLTHEELSEFVGYSVPTLASALESFCPLLWNLEIKEAAAVPIALSVLSRFQSSHRFLLTSFDHPAIAEVVRCVSLDAGLLVAHRPLEAVSLAEWFPREMRQKFVVWDFQTADPAVVDRAAAQGIQSLAYGVHTREEHDRVAGWNLYGVITDHPEFLLGADRRPVRHRDETNLKNP